jgi:hypothetical protein
MTLVVLQFDPGPRETGIIVRAGEELLAADVVIRKTKGQIPDGPFLREVVAAGRAMAEPHGDYIVGVEGVRYWHQDDPDRRVQRRNLQAVISTGMMYGAIVVRWPQAIWVEPGKGYGQKHALFYPEQIRPPTGSTSGSDRKRHCRACWDQSYVAETTWNRMQRERVM